MIRKVIVHIKGGTSAEWLTKDPVLDSREPGIEVDTGLWKFGDGVHKWSELDYFLPKAAIQQMIDESGGGGGIDPTALTDHINSPNPHPIYDNGPSLALRYQNVKAG